jgi:hypothetical protein
MDPVVDDKLKADRVCYINWRKSGNRWASSINHSVRRPNKIFPFQFGDSVALYFSSLPSYSRALIFPSILGTVFYLLGQPYSLLYSTLLLLWSITFVEWWRIRELILSVRLGTRISLAPPPTYNFTRIRLAPNTSSIACPSLIKDQSRRHFLTTPSHPTM